MDDLFNPALLLFLLGISIGLLFKLTLLENISKYLGYYLLLSLGIKGGLSIQENGFMNEVITTLSLGIIFAILIPLVSYFYLKKLLNTDDAAALSATYGSVSAVTFVTAISYLSTTNQVFDNYMSAVLVVMEFPAIFMALYLVTQNNQNKNNKLQTIKTAFLEVPNIILITSLMVGYFANKNLVSNLDFLILDIFNYVLYLFLFVMGTRVASRIGELKGKGKKLLTFAVITPLTGSSIALLASLYFNLSVGNATLLMVLAASASYIAVPAVVKDAIPNANPAIYLGLSLGVTFPFNIIIGIPFYNEFAKFLIG